MDIPILFTIHYKGDIPVIGSDTTTYTVDTNDKLSKNIVKILDYKGNLVSNIAAIKFNSNEVSVDYFGIPRIYQGIHDPQIIKQEIEADIKRGWCGFYFTISNYIDRPDPTIYNKYGEKEGLVQSFTFSASVNDIYMITKLVYIGKIVFIEGD